MTQLIADHEITRGRPTAAILAGGLGTRLRPVFAGGPKALAPLGGRPFVTYLLDQLETEGVERVVMCTGYRAEDVSAALGNRYGRLELVYSVEASPLGTGGALRNCLPLVESDPLLIMNGDSWCDFHLPTFRAFHQARHAEGSIWLVPGSETSGFGRVEIDGTGEVMAFHEKTLDPSAWINAGIYLLSRSIIEAIEPGVAVSLEHEVFPRWSGRGLFGCPKGRAPVDIGTPESYCVAEAMLDSLPRGSRRSKRPRRRAVLLDRDGTICVERNYLTDPAEVELLPGAAAGLRKLRALGLKLVLVTNQSALARGDLTPMRLSQIHGRLSDLLKAEGASLDAIYVCPHRADQRCECRKPAAGMLWAAAKHLDFEPRTSFVIGDKLCDTELGRKAGAVSILVTTGYGAEVQALVRPVADYVVDNLADAADVIEYLLWHEEVSWQMPDEGLTL